VSLPLDEAYLRELVREFPSVRLVEKERDSLSRVIDRLLRTLTLGGQRHYLDRYTTVLGSAIYVPTSWRTRSPEDRYLTLRHEAVHLRQTRRYGVVGMALRYAFFGLPLGLAWGRAQIEWEAYRETLAVAAELWGLPAAEAMRGHIVAQFTSAAYGWMWPFPSHVNAWFDRAIEELRKGRA
jgi:hypothetical protein